MSYLNASLFSYSSLVSQRIRNIHTQACFIIQTLTHSVVHICVHIYRCQRIGYSRNARHITSEFAHVTISYHFDKVFRIHCNFETYGHIFKADHREIQSTVSYGTNLRLPTHLHISKHETVFQFSSFFLLLTQRKTDHCWRSIQFCARAFKIGSWAAEL